VSKSRAQAFWPTGPRRDRAPTAIDRLVDSEPQGKGTSSEVSPIAPEGEHRLDLSGFGGLRLDQAGILGCVPAGKPLARQRSPCCRRVGAVALSTGRTEPAAILPLHQWNKAPGLRLNPCPDPKLVLMDGLTPSWPSSAGHLFSEALKPADPA